LVVWNIWIIFHLGKNHPIWLLYFSEKVGQPPSSLSKDCWFHQPTHVGMMNWWCDVQIQQLL
jgi:hypothetical protein